MAFAFEKLIVYQKALLTAHHHVKLKSDLEEIAKMLSGLINGLHNRKVLTSQMKSSTGVQSPRFAEGE